MTYTAYDGAHAPPALPSISVDDFLARRFDRWSKPFILTPENVDDKDLALLPKRSMGTTCSITASITKFAPIYYLI